MNLHSRCTCKTTLLDRMKIAAMRYKQPMIFSLSKMRSAGEEDVISAASVAVLCIRLIVRAPTTQSSVPTIFTLLYKQPMFTFSILSQERRKDEADHKERSS